MQEAEETCPAQGGTGVSFSLVGSSELLGGSLAPLQRVRRLGGSLCELDLSNNALGPLGAVPQLVEAIAHAPLRRLRLEGNELRDEGCSLLARALLAPALRQLDLGRNSVGAAGCRALAESLALRGCMLRALDLSENRVGNGGAVALGGALRRNDGALTSLDLSSNAVAGEGALALAAFALPAALWECRL